jgi:hypothetical protein
VDRNELRYRATSALLQATGPLSLAEVAREAGVPARSLSPVLAEMGREKLVVSGRLAPGARSRQFRWAARWKDVSGRAASDSRRGLLERMASEEVLRERELGIDSPPVTAFCDYILEAYRPPEGKRFLVFLQCSVRRPFSKSPSHGSMKKAIRLATGHDPAKDFDTCPVHIVVLASRIGPVPYELEDVYPANVGGGGVKHFSPDHYTRVRPVLADRVARYIQRNRRRYKRIATFTDSRYGEVMADARSRTGVEFPIFPALGGAVVESVGNSRPRTYWARCWIQLFLEVASWLGPEEQAQADERLRKLKVTYTGGSTSGARKGGKRRSPAASRRAKAKPK